MATDIDDLYDGPWVDCWKCGGAGQTEDCFEDTCCCMDPPCYWQRCDICKGEGGWPLTDDDDDDALGDTGKEKDTENDV